MSLFDKATSIANQWLGNLLESSANMSEWQGLNKHLIATFYPVESKATGGKREWTRVFTELPVKAPILEGAEMEYSFNWQSPFEQMGTEAKAPALTAMLQSGALADFYSGFQSRFLGQEAQESQNNAELKQALADMEGRTGITKLNSMQTFAGMPPVKCTMKLLFRAYSNPITEVMNPINQLLQWAVPKELSPDGTLANLVDAAADSYQNQQLQSKRILDALMPSKSPTIIAMEYKGRRYMPMIIESISDPITSPTTADGKYASAEVNLTISSLTAWDKADIQQFYGII